MANRGIDQIHSFIEFIERKEMGSYHTHAQIDAALDAAQKELFKQYLEQYTSSLDKKLPSALYPFRTSAAFTSTSSGIITYPADLEHLLVLYPLTNGLPNTVRIVEFAELPEALNSQLRRVSTTRPIGIDGDKEFQIFPKEVRSGNMYYLRSPKTPLFSYTQVGRVVTYNAGTSVNLEFSDIYVDKIISKALMFLGINMSEAEIVNFGATKDAQITV
jgi:hypothetical protein